MSCRLVHSVVGFALVALGCAVEEPAGPSTPAAGGGGAASGGGVETPSGGGAPDMMGGQTGEGGGQLDACSAETWDGPDAQRVKAHCQAPNQVHATRYCTCDTRACPLDANGDPDRACAIAVPFDNSRCSDTLFQVCGVRHDNWCGISGLSSLQRKTCWTQPDGTHLCQCPDRAELEPSSETVCFMALNKACAGDCQSELGRCQYVAPVSGQRDDLNQFRCECARGVAGTSPAYFCEDALRRHCAPGCQSARGACWKVPDSSGLVNTADCLCTGSDQFVHLTESQWDPHGEGCLAPLVQACGE